MRSTRWLSPLLERLSIRWRLVLASFSLFAVLMSVLGIMISVTEEEALLSSQAEMLKQTATLLDSGTFNPAREKLIAQKTIDEKKFTKLSPEVSEKLILTIYETLGKNVSVAILYPNGSPMITDEVLTGQSKVMLDKGRVLEWIESQQPYLVTDDGQQRRLVVLYPMQIADEMTKEQVPTILQLSVPTQAIDQAVNNARLILLLGVVGALLIAGALTPPLIGTALRPLVEMERVSGQIAGGKLSLRLREPRVQDEVGRLAHSFNYMVARLEKAFARQKQFVADVSHELRTPLTGLGGSLEMLLLEADKGDPEASHRLMRGMYTEVERMHRIVEDLLVLSRLDEGQIRWRKEKVNVGKLVYEVCEQAQQLVRGQELSCTIAASHPVVHGNADQLRRVLLNVVENALKFTPASGRVSLIVSVSPARGVIIEVSDTGIGIPSEALPYVFDRFYRVDSSRTRSTQQGGSGLGLSIAQGLVYGHGGTIGISSTPGSGTTVVIQLPMIEHVSKSVGAGLP